MFFYLFLVQCTLIYLFPPFFRLFAGREEHARLEQQSWCSVTLMPFDASRWRVFFFKENSKSRENLKRAQFVCVQSSSRYCVHLITLLTVLQSAVKSTLWQKNLSATIHSGFRGSGSVGWELTKKTYLCPATPLKVQWLCKLWHFTGVCKACVGQWLSESFCVASKDIFYLICTWVQ